ncbi:MAG: hypothetical protein ROO71_05945 [Balneola sp.]
MLHRYSFLIILIFTLNCSSNGIGNDDIQVDPELIKELRSSSSETLQTESNSFILDAYLWRDFMPISPPNGQPLIAINKLIETNSDTIPHHIDLVKQYVIHDNTVWVTDYEDEQRNSNFPYIIEKVSRDGPKWDTGISVDVVAKVYNSKTRENHYLILKNVTINRTD